MLEVRRVKMDDSPLRGDVMWVLFEKGEIRRPLAMLTDYEMDRLVCEVRRQQEEHEEGK